MSGRHPPPPPPPPPPLPLPPHQHAPSHQHPPPSTSSPGSSSSHSNHHPHPHPHPHPQHMQNISTSDLQFLCQTQHSLGVSPAASSPSPGSSNSSGLSLDSNALTALSMHFDGLMAAITARIQTLSEQTRASTQATHRRSSHVVDRATVEIETLRDILRQCDELETEFLKIKRLGEMVKGFRKRVETLEKRMGR